MKKTFMKKLLTISAALLCSLALTLTATSCADANGLHNQESSEVTFVFTNFKTAEDGDYSLPGDYSSTTWDNTVTQVAIKDGEGTATPVTMCSTSTTFTLVKPNSWSRAWCTGTCYANAWDNDSASYCNFYVDGIPMGTTATVTIDGSTTPVTITVQ